MRQGRSRLALAGAVATFALAGASVPAQAGTSGFELTPVGGDFQSPVFVTSAPGTGRAILVVEKRGVVWIVRGKNRRAKPFLDISDRVASQGEGGLLSLAFSPNGGPRFYAYYTTNRRCAIGCDIQVDEFKRKRGKLKVRDGYRRKVIGIRHRSASNHNGGTAMFGPDGKLWLATGDGGGGGDPNDNARDTTSLLGKLLRIIPRESAKRGYRIPKSNPFRGVSGFRSQIWSIGLRNPFRFSFADDPAVSSEGPVIAIGDVGQGAREEIDIVPVADAKGADFGWPAFEGDQPYDPSRPSAIPASMRIDPIYAYPRPVNPPDGTLRGVSVTGGIFSQDERLAGTAFDPSNPTYVFGEAFTQPNLRSLHPDVEAQTFTGLQGHPQSAGTVVGFGQNSVNRIYIADLRGTVKRIDPATP